MHCINSVAFSVAEGAATAALNSDIRVCAIYDVHSSAAPTVRTISSVCNAKKLAARMHADRVAATD
jgi:hypothetical protein